MSPGRFCLLACLGAAMAVPTSAVGQTATTHQHPAPAPAAAAVSAEDHSAHQPGGGTLPPFIPPVTDEDRAAAFPDVHGHAVHDGAVNFLVLIDQLEWQTGRGTQALDWDTRGWIGGDRQRLWFRSEGARVGRITEDAHTELLYGRAVARWWDVTAGIRVDTLPDTPRTALALGVQGLAPYWFDIEASAYVEPSGRTHVRVETEYELRVTNRLILQPLAEVDVHGRADLERGLGAGLSTGDVGLRLRYELKRELAPYVGVVWTRRFFGTADLARSRGEEATSTRLALGLRTWF